MDKSKYPSSFFRVSVKALIRNNQGELLLVNEHFDDWVLPGGGIDHGETAEAALKRELHEELGVNNIISASLSSTFAYYAPIKQTWCLWLLYDVEIESYDVLATTDTSAAAFIDIGTFRESKIYSEQRIYKALKT